MFSPVASRREKKNSKRGRTFVIRLFSFLALFKKEKQTGAKKKDAREKIKSVYKKLGLPIEDKILITLSQNRERKKWGEKSIDVSIKAFKYFLYLLKLKREG